MSSTYCCPNYQQQHADNLSHPETLIHPIRSIIV